MANEVKGVDRPLKDILATALVSYYQIPDYQRPYQWTEKNCTKLLDDLFSSYEYYKGSGYFCGSLVLIVINTDSETNAETYDIVDGQQRLSTFILLAKVLATLYDKDLKPTSRELLEKSLGDIDGEKRERLHFNAMGLNAKDDFVYALEHFNDSQASKNKNNKNNYLKNAICLKNYLKEKEIEDINDFIKWLYFKVVFIKTTCPNVSMALRIFSVLNARGLALNATDIFKGELLKHAKEHEREEFVSRWNDLSQKCSDNDLKIETLFSWYLTYLNPVTSKEKMEKRLVTWFNKLNKTPLEYLKGVEDFYNAYGEVLGMQDRHAYLLSYKDDDYLRVILCASLLHRYSDQDIEALKELLVKFYYQNWVATREEPKKQTNCNIIKALKEKKSVESIASIVKEYLDYHKITQDFKKNLQDSKLYEQHKKSSKNSWLRPILILVEYSMSDDPRPKRIQMNDFHVEHILPQQPGSSSQWVKDFSEEERELYTHSLANLTLLGGTKNTQASNKDFKEKKEIYMGNAVKLGKDKRGREKTFKVMTCYKMTIDVAQCTEWTPTSLEKRKEELIQKIESVLAL
ncbi:DUF262 domain-containing protein [Helicobacter pylori]|uniref:DUF262 domain-containing protein n=1 Tax=Helicobacter pylori TaxID=210 RepID=UPI0018D1E45B|nr:DUF262 domain-containing protein [Helicobacter pylori]MBH0282859.1 DUF262 domain-containing protein [Helicobacter pylori]MBH0287696.1 DUF262 domain-containing protein [Helicobacter pylori]MBH0290294.1 DUF262 domain-containing protein [Helicobacter pylori]